MDLAGHLVVVPGGRAGRRLQELLLEGAEARGRSLRPPEVVTAGGLPERLYLPGRPPPPGLASRLAWALALQTVPDHRLRLLTTRRPRHSQLPGWLALAGLVEGLHRELAAEGLSFREVSGVFSRSSLFDDGARWDVLEEVRKRAFRFLEGGGWMDREEARRRALGRGEVQAPGPLWLVALPELPGIVREMVAALPDPVRVLIHAPGSEEGGFHPDGTIRPEAWWNREMPLDRARTFVEGGPGAQAARVAREMAALEGRYSAEEVVVGVADGELLPFLFQVLEVRGVPLRDPAGRPLARTGPGLLLDAVARHLEEDDASSLAALLRHPGLEDWLREGGISPGHAIRTLDAYRQAALPGHLGAGPLPGAPDDGARRRTEAVRSRIEPLLEAFRVSRPLPAWTGAFRQFFQAIHGDRVLEEGSGPDRELMAFLSGLRRVLGEAEALAGVDGQRRSASGEGAPAGQGAWTGEGSDPGPSPLAPAVDGASAIRVFLGELEGESVPPPEEEAAVEALGWLELHLDDAPVLLLVGVNDPHLPASVVGHPFLPDALRSALGIPDNRARKARDAYRLSAILRSRDRTVLVSGRRSASGDPLRPSPLLLQGPPAEMARRILAHLAGPGASEDPPPADPPTTGDVPIAGDAPIAGTAPVAGTTPIAGGSANPGDAPIGGDAPGPPLPLPPEPTLQPPGLPLRIRVTAFRSLLADPYRWLLGQRIGGPSPDRWVDDEGREMEAMVFGALAHDVLEHLGGDLRREQDSGRLERGLEEALREEGRRRFGTRPLPAVQIQLAQLALRFSTLARVEATHRARGWEVAAVEASAPREGVLFPVDDDEVFLTGRVDRVDRHAELGWLVLDYKTSEVARSPEATHRKGRGASGREWVDLQLPLYRHVAPRLVGRDGAPLAEGPAPSDPLLLGYYNLPRRLETLGIALAEWTADELEEADERARQALRPLLRGDAMIFDPARMAAAGSADDLAPLLGVGVLAPSLAEEGESDD